MKSDVAHMGHIRLVYMFLVYMFSIFSLALIEISLRLTNFN